MTDPDQDEFVALRRRAYARGADIHLDPASLARLDELENANRPVADESVGADEAPTESPPAVTEPAAGSTPDDSPPTPWWVAAARHAVPLLERAGRRLRGLRRSTVLIALGTVLTLAALLTTLVVVQRVQTDPLQVGAVQVARLAVDGGYENPFPDFLDPTESDREIRGYQEFHGLRVITGLNAFFSPYLDPRENDCMVVYVVSTLDVGGEGFGGTIFSGCGAGDFPAIVQLPLDQAELPDDLAAAYPDARGVQFVYDRENDEVVVFVDR